MRLLASLSVVLWAAGAALARPAPGLGEPSWPRQPGAAPHPAVVRVIVPDSTGHSYGSGALVAIRESHGLVVTNWHVVRDAAGPILVAFPDGFRSGATVLGTDRDWDLAALAIWRPPVEPIPLAMHPPQPGEPLTIAGYGNGWYRAVTGRCTQYVSPGPSHPFEMVELSAGAREGDSGGPILNSRGELAGVLFGTASGETTGSYCGRVRQFLAAVVGEFDHLTPGSTMIARQPEPDPAMIAQARRPATTMITELPQSRPMTPPGSSVAPDQGPSTSLPVAAIRAEPPPPGDWRSAAPGPETGWRASPADPNRNGPVAQLPATQPLSWEDIAGRTRGDQLKTILAAIGVIAILFHGMRLLNNGDDS